MLSLQPLLLGLILLANRLWTLGAILVGGGAVIITLVEAYASIKLREPGVKSLSGETQNALEDFEDVARTKHVPATQHDDKAPDEAVLRERRISRRTRTSFASILDMISLTLAVSPSAGRHQGPVPLPTETIDDLVSTARAAATNPDAPPRLRPVDPADDTAHLLYPPELLAPVPLIWLSNDVAGIGRSEAVDLQRYHHLEVVLDAPIVPPAEVGARPRPSREHRSGDYFDT